LLKLEAFSATKLSTVERSTDQPEFLYQLQ
jgi:hypothetical protein